MSNSRLKPLSVHRIREALAGIDVALRYEPIPEDAGVGDERGIEVVISDPGGGSRFDMVDAGFEPDPVGDAVEEPLVVFEVPPQMTDAEIRNTLGDNRIGELQRLHEIRGVDAYGWYLSFHQLSGQYGIYIRFEAIVWLTLQFLQEVDMPFERKVS
jgi:hypothetical protein